MTDISYQFEVFTMEYHRGKYQHETKLWKEIPEDWLYNSGYLIEFRRYRKIKIEAHEKKY